MKPVKGSFIELGTEQKCNFHIQEEQGEENKVHSFCLHLPLENEQTIGVLIRSMKKQRNSLFRHIALPIIITVLLAACGQSTDKRSLQGTGPDSLYTEKHIIKIFLAEPQRALALIDTAIAQGNVDPIRGEVLRAVVYQDALNNLPAAMDCYLKIWQEDSVKLYPVHNTNVLESMSTLSYSMEKYEESLEYAIEGLKVARESGQAAAEAMFHFDIAKSQQALGRLDEAWESMKQCVEPFEKSKNPQAWPYLSYYYSEQMLFLAERKDFDEALKVAEKRKKLIERMAESDLAMPDNYLDQQRAYLSSKYCYLYAQTGKWKKAEEQLNEFMNTRFAHSERGLHELLPYYQLTQQWHAILKVYQEQPLTATLDSFSNAYTEALTDMATAYEHLGDTRQALLMQKRIRLLNDSIQRREQQSEAMELDTRYRTHEQKLLLAEEKAKSEARLTVNIALAVVILVLCILAFMVYRSSRKTMRKNRLLVKKMEVLDTCREQLRQTREELDNCRAQIDEARRKKVEKMLQSAESPTVSDSEKDKTLNREIFNRLESIMQAEQIFKNPSLSRDDIAQRLHVNRNRLAEIIQQNTENDLTAYLNQLRFNHAISLIRQQVQYTVQGIATESGFANVRTLQRIFKEELEMTPSEYIKAQKQKNGQNGI